MNSGQNVSPRLFPSRSSLQERLGTDLWAAVQRVGIPLIEAHLVTTLRSAQLDRACFRLRFADRRVLKGRLVERIDVADRLEDVSRLLDPRHFPPVLARHGRALLTDWIDGTPIGPADCTADVLRFAGALQSSLHRIPVPNVIAWRRRPEDWRPPLDQNLRELVDARVLDGRAAGLAYQLAEHHAPQRVSAGLCHGDLCAENIIRARSGRLVIVDNDSVAIDSYEYDLARTWHRWPMTQRQRAIYIAGYGQRPQWDHFTAHFTHWAILVLVNAAAFRLRVGAAGAHKPLNRLHRLLATSGFGGMSRVATL